MSKQQQQQQIYPLTGYFLRWADDHTPHKQLELATVNGNQLVKIAKSLRPHLQNLQPGICLTLLGQKRIDRTTGETKIKVKQLLMPRQIQPPNPPAIDEYLPIVTTPVEPTKIRVCQGSSCRRRGSEQMCRSMQVYLDRNNLTDTVQIETVKCLHQCKAAPHAIVTSPVGCILPGKTHYRQLQPSQVQVILAKHFPVAAPAKPIGLTLIEKIGDYFHQQCISTSNTLS